LFGVEVSFSQGTGLLKWTTVGVGGGVLGLAIKVNPGRRICTVPVVVAERFAALCLARKEFMLKVMQLRTQFIAEEELQTIVHAYLP
jgi:hypothetical protein